MRHSQWALDDGRCKLVTADGISGLTALAAAKARGGLKAKLTQHQAVPPTLLGLGLNFSFRSIHGLSLDGLQLI